MAKKENKTSIDLVTVNLSEDKINELKEYNGKLQQVMTQLGQIHIRKNELHSELGKIDEAVTQAEESFKETNSEMRKELNKLERDYPRGQLNMEKGKLLTTQLSKNKWNNKHNNNKVELRWVTMVLVVVML